MAAKYAGYASKLNTLRARVEHVRDLGKEVSLDNSNEEKIKSFMVQSKKVDKLVQDYEKAYDLLMEVENKPDTHKDEDLKKIMELDDIVAEIGVVREEYEQVNRNVSVKQENGIKLPNISLPNFSGNIADWTSFISLFKSLVEQNSALSNIERLQYLRTSLKGEPSDLIRGLDLTNENYQVALKILEERYENVRKIAITHAEKVMSYPAAQTPSVKHLRGLITTYHEHVEALRALGVDGASNNEGGAQNNLFLYLILFKKLDPTVRFQFERGLSSSKELPTPSQLIQFLERECQAMEAAGESKPNFVRKIDSGRVITTLTTDNRICLGCNTHSNHRLYQCSVFLRKPAAQRKQFVQENKLCFNCLGEHLADACGSNNRCLQCQGKHHSVIHLGTRVKSWTSNRGNKKEGIAEKGTPEDKSESDNIQVSCSATFDRPQRGVILSTVVVGLQNSYGKFEPVRCLLDCGSQASYVTYSCAQRLQMRIQNAGATRVLGLAQQGVKVKGLVSLHMRHREGGSRLLSTDAMVLDNITGQLPTMKLSTDLREDLGDLPLADPNFDCPSVIDVLLGADIFAQCLRNGRMELGAERPILLRTIFGWIVMGRSGAVSNGMIATHHAVVEESLDTTLQQFWRVEEPHCPPVIAQNDQRVEQHFRSTHSRDNGGRYVVRLPFKDTEMRLGWSYSLAESRFLSLERKLARDNNTYDMYRKFMNEYIESGDMEICDPPDIYEKEVTHYYLPHHGVVKPTSTTTKLRVVFDASAKTGSNSRCSLNEMLHSGPKLQQDIMQILIRFRTHQIAFAADIQQMFRRVLVHPDDRNFQLILWRNNQQEKLRTYRLNTVTFGLTCSPFLAMRSVLQLAWDDGEKYPEASRILQRDIFVDDLVSGADSVDTCLVLQRQLIQLLKGGGFRLRKWISNSPALLASVPVEERESPLSFTAPDVPVYQILGIGWLATVDKFVFTAGNAETPITKRGILSCIARFYDPLGFLAPVIMWAKMLLQYLWVNGLGWDAELSEDLTAKWKTYVEELSQLSAITIPRYFGTRTGSLHGFSDASERGYAAVVYLCPGLGEIGLPTIVMAKTKVAPLRKVSLPRLELCGAHLLAKLLVFVRESLGEHMNITDVVAWSDSTTAISWIRMPPYRLKTFVATRVSEIQGWVPPDKWRHVPTSENPADSASRGLYPSQFVKSSTWFSGPSFLKEPIQNWPNLMPPIDLEKVPEQRPNPINVLSGTTGTAVGLDLWDRFSSWEKLRRVVAYMIRFVNNASRPNNMRCGPLSPSEIRIATVSIFKIVQQECFSTELRALQRGATCDGRMASLTPFVDTAGLLRVGGRIANADVTYGAKHPILLPRSHSLTTLIIEHYHRVYLHAGPRLLQSLLTQKYWIPACRAAVRKCTRNCMKCFRHKPYNEAPQMAELPTNRVRLARAFLSVHVDMAGPFVLRSHRRSTARYKGYLCIFICSSTKAVHLEAVSELSTSAFIAALHRFISRRGLCTDIYSDCGTNFVGANKEIKKAFQFINSSPQKQALSEFATSQGFNWHFQPPSAPHFGGLHEAAVRLAKFHIVRVVGKQVLTFEEISTLFARVEAVLNSRPLCPLSDDPTEVDVLTPGHFLVGGPLVALPDRETQLHSFRTRWQLLQQMSQHFWRRWKVEYLHTLIQRSKWHRRPENIKSGMMVLIQEDRTPPLEWRLGRITEVHPGKDGVVRVVGIRTSMGNLTRPVVKIFPLPSQ